MNIERPISATAAISGQLLGANSSDPPSSHLPGWRNFAEGQKATQGLCRSEGDAVADRGKRPRRKEGGEEFARHEGPFENM
jgi:hypothetical protein